jgi:hypothetical protein
MHVRFASAGSLALARMGWFIVLDGVRGPLEGAPYWWIAPLPQTGYDRIVPRFSSVAEDALALDPADRLRLASELIDSVEGPPDPDWATAWAAELRHRSTGADEREARGLPRGSEWSDVRARLLLELTRP